MKKAIEINNAMECIINYEMAAIIKDDRNYVFTDESNTLIKTKGMVGEVIIYVHNSKGTKVVLLRIPKYAIAAIHKAITEIESIKGEGQACDFDDY